MCIVFFRRDKWILVPSIDVKIQISKYIIRVTSTWHLSNTWLSKINYAFVPNGLKMKLRHAHKRKAWYHFLITIQSRINKAICYSPITKMQFSIGREHMTWSLAQTKLTNFLLRQQLEPWTWTWSGHVVVVDKFKLLIIVFFVLFFAQC